jgi:hypothetical protein
MEARIGARGLVAALLLAAGGWLACGRGEAQAASAATCPPLELKLDGAAQTWTNVLAYRMRGNTVVRIYNHDGVTCEHLLEDKPLSVPRTEQLINITVMSGTAYVTYAPDPSGGQASKGKVVTRGEKAGDTLGLCLPDLLTLAGKGVHEGQTVTIQGLVEAKFCGDHK